MSMYLYLFVLDNLRKESRNGSWSWLLDFTKMICWKCWLLAAATLLYSLLEIWDMFWKLSVQAWVVVLVRTMILIVYYIHSNLLRCTIWCPLGLSKVTFFRGGALKKTAGPRDTVSLGDVVCEARHAYWFVKQDSSRPPCQSCIHGDLEMTFIGSFAWMWLDPWHPCTVYFPTFTMQINQM